VIVASDLIGCVVRTESGVKLGRVHELRMVGRPGDTGRLIGLVVGRGALLARLGITGAGRRESLGSGRVIPWQAITRLGDGSITVSGVIAVER
jgi:sporulation protein YlmC with PRC-barrel domain